MRNRTAPPPVVVDIGCGSRKRRDAIGLDAAPLPGVDVLADLDRGLPFRDSSVDTLIAYHVLEHCRDFTAMMAEIWRVLRHDGRALIKVPHASSPFVTWKDPTHRRGLSLATFTYFDDTYFDGKVFSYYSPVRFRIDRARLNFTMTDRPGAPPLLPPDARDVPPPEPHAFTVARRVLNPLFDALANNSRAAQYVCERFWGPLVGIEEASLVMRAIKRHPANDAQSTRPTIDSHP